MRPTRNRMTRQTKPRAIAVVDVGFTNSKVILYDADLNVLAERKTASPHHDGPQYREIDVAAILDFVRLALHELDTLEPIDVIVPCAHGACIVCLKQDGSIAVPVMDYMSEPPAEITVAYQQIMPGFDESYSPFLPMALLHGMQLYWQSNVLPRHFAQTQTILPLMQYVGFVLGGKAVTEVSSMSCQSHLVDMRTGSASSLATSQGWSKHFAPQANAWDGIGIFQGLRGEGKILAGVHDSNANFLRYLAAGEDRFTLLSTGTWIIGFDTDADMTRLDHAKDIVANKSVFGKTIACSRFFGGKEFEILAQGASGEEANLASARKLIDANIMAVPSFSDSGGPVPGTGGKGRILGGEVNTAQDRATLASIYCAQMVSESLDALHSNHTVIVDGPFSQNDVFLGVLASLRPRQTIMASEARDGTAAGAACLALMPDGQLPRVPLTMRRIIADTNLPLERYHQHWKETMHHVSTHS
jgi:sugar (pentulose or hexulose) kinase